MDKTQRNILVGQAFNNAVMLLKDKEPTDKELLDKTIQLAKIIEEARDKYFVDNLPEVGVDESPLQA